MQLHSQKGFSALGLFLLGLVMLAVMSVSGLFDRPISEVDETQKFTASGATQIEGKGLLVSEINFATPTETPSTIPPEGPTSPPQQVPIPTPVEDYCHIHQNKQADPQLCQCTSWFVKCEGGVCVDANPERSGIKKYSTAKEMCEYMDKNNLCERYGNDGTGWYCIGKPVIYLYPEFPMLVDISIKTAGKVIVSDPQIEKDSSWKKVMAHPNGILFYDNHAYRELFYETETTDINPPEEGLIFNNAELETKLLNFVKQLGLTRSDEQKEFMDWWIPRLKTYDSPYWMVSVLEKEEKQRLDKVEIHPSPDTFIEFIVYFKPLDNYKEVTTLHLPPTPERKGFTAVEWGGVIDSHE